MSSFIPGVWNNRIKQSTNSFWIFIGRADAEAPIFWPPDAKSRLIRKDPDVGKDWRQEEKGTTEDEMVGWHHWLDGHEFEQAQEILKHRGAWCAAVHGVTRVRHYWATEQKQQQLVVSLKHLFSSCEFTKKKKKCQHLKTNNMPTKLSIFFLDWNSPTLLLVRIYICRYFISVYKCSHYTHTYICIQKHIHTFKTQPHI